MYMYIYIYVCIYTNLPVNAIVRLSINTKVKGIEP